MQEYKYKENERFIFFKRNWFLLQAQVKGRLRLLLKKLHRPSTTNIPSKNLKYLGSGWEWDTYLNKDTNKILKFHSGIFSHTGTKEYVDSIQENYNLLQQKDNDLIVPTEFITKNRNYLIQDKIQPYHKRLFFKRLTVVERQSLIRILKIMLELMEEYQWMPDLRPKYFTTSFYLSNINWNGDLKRFQIFDYSSALDLFRIDPKFTESQIKLFTNRILKILTKLEN